jgi:DNA-3-methyladenine glycosylase II
MIPLRAAIAPGALCHCWLVQQGLGCCHGGLVQQCLGCCHCWLVQQCLGCCHGGLVQQGMAGRHFSAIQQRHSTSPPFDSVRLVVYVLDGCGILLSEFMPAQIPPETIRAARRHLLAADAVLADVIRRVGPFRLRLQTRRFESLARAIIAQQISGAAARSIWERLREAVRPGSVTPERLARLSDPALRACGISPQKLGYLRDLQQRVLTRTVRLHHLHRLDDQDVIAELVQIKGIGVWTAQMFLMFSLGRLDVLPHQDLGIRSAIQRLYGLDALPDRSQCEQVASPWRPYATVACWYLWRSSSGGI